MFICILQCIKISHIFSTLKISLLVYNNKRRGEAQIAQNIAEPCQKYFPSYIPNEILSKHFYQLLQNIFHRNFTI